jgi:hypothetical protein
MGLKSLGLTASWDKLAVGDLVDIQAEIVVFDPHGVKHLFEHHWTRN